MEIVRARSVPNLRNVEDISWPLVPVTELCLGKAETHPTYQRQQKDSNSSPACKYEAGIDGPAEDVFFETDKKGEQSHKPLIESLSSTKLAAPYDVFQSPLGFQDEDNTVPCSTTRVSDED